MDKQEADAAILADLESRIDTMQNMGDEELGTFGWYDWVILLMISIVLPAIAIVIFR
jgi:hypothetical protein